MFSFSYVRFDSLMGGKYENEKTLHFGIMLKNPELYQSGGSLWYNSGYTKVEKKVWPSPEKEQLTSLHRDPHFEIVL